MTPYPGSLQTGVHMRPKERRDSGQTDLFRTRLNQTIDVKHPLVKLVAAIGWPGLETHFGAGQTAFFTGDYYSCTFRLRCEIWAIA
jgi:hypothetical protein